MPDLSQDGQASAIGASMEMCSAGAREFRAWELDNSERAKSNAVANLVDRVYRAMEEVRRSDCQS